MILNLILVVIGIIALIYGIKNKLKLWIIVGGILLCAGLVSAYVDYSTGGLDGLLGHRIPFAIDNMVK